MKLLLLVALSLAVLPVVCSRQQSRVMQVDGEEGTTLTQKSLPKWDHFVLTREWTPTYCVVEKVSTCTAYSAYTCTC